MTQNICKNCGNNFTGKFCNNCGEKVYTEHDKSMHHFLHETFHFFTHLDNKFFKTLFLIFRRPGLLSVTYCSGVRDKYYKPVSLFFIGVILYLLFPYLPGLNMSFKYNLINLNAQHLGFIAELANKKAAAKHISLQELEAVYNHKSAAIAKIMLLIILPLTGLALKLLFAKKRKYFFDYLILATEASCVMIYLNFLILPLVLSLIAWTLNYFHFTSIKLLGDSVTLSIYGFFIIYWTIVALRRFFEISLLQSLLKGFLFLFLQSVIIFIIYRLILFLTVLAFI